MQLLITADEEIGSKENRGLIEASARQARAVLVMEGATEKGALKLGRRGVGRVHLHVDGIAAHAGNDAAQGVSAIHQLAQLICELVALAAPERGTLINVGQISGGTTVNTIAAQSDAWVDLRLASQDEVDRVMTALHCLKPTDPRARLQVEGGVNRPVWQPSLRDRQLFACAEAVAVARGEHLQGVAVEGGGGWEFYSSFCAYLGWHGRLWRSSAYPGRVDRDRFALPSF
ncbi:MAG: peptidase dimerization domain-containing protein [Firmicutes bacterium]|nr:peptidase dimerization domain-containing protein [Bacillota bacterium]